MDSKVENDFLEVPKLAKMTKTSITSSNVMEIKSILVFFMQCWTEYNPVLINFALILTYLKKKQGPDLHIIRVSTLKFNYQRRRITGKCAIAVALVIKRQDEDGLT